MRRLGRAEIRATLRPAPKTTGITHGSSEPSSWVGGPTASGVTRRMRMYRWGGPEGRQARSVHDVRAITEARALSGEGLQEESKPLRKSKRRDRRREPNQQLPRCGTSCPRREPALGAWPLTYKLDDRPASVGHRKRDPTVVLGECIGVQVCVDLLGDRDAGVAEARPNHALP